MDYIFSWVCSRPIKPCYIVDLPRGMKTYKLAYLYSGIEVIRSGFCYDKIYHAKKVWFARPIVVVFTNVLPNYELMSGDRWKTWTVNDDK